MSDEFRALLDQIEELEEAGRLSDQSYTVACEVAALSTRRGLPGVTVEVNWPVFLGWLCERDEDILARIPGGGNGQDGA